MSEKSCKCHKCKGCDGPEIDLKPFIIPLLIGFLFALIAGNPYKTWAW